MTPSPEPREILLMTGDEELSGLRDVFGVRGFRLEACRDLRNGLIRVLSAGHAS
jgi:hypothetical protein